MEWLIGESRAVCESSVRVSLDRVLCCTVSNLIILLTRFTKLHVCIVISFPVSAPLRSKYCASVTFTFDMLTLNLQTLVIRMIVYHCIKFDRSAICIVESSNSAYCNRCYCSVVHRHVVCHTRASC